MARKQDIIERIEAYLNKEEHHHAMLLYGEWGSGKSRFVRGELKNHLENAHNPNVMIYTSAVGVSSADELLERLVAAYVNELAGIDALEDCSKKTNLLNVIKGAGISFLSKKAKDAEAEFGVSFSPQSDVFLSLALPSRCLVVIDDVERMKKEDNLEDDTIFSALCRLVEEQRHNVLLIADSIESVSANAKEKIVWERMAFEPDIPGLVDDLLGDIIEKYPLDVQDEVRLALGTKTNCNARRLIRIRPVLEAMSNCAFLKEDAADRATRKATLADVLTIALRLSDGLEPVKPDEKMSWMEFEENGWYYERCTSLGFLKDYFAKGSLASLQEMDNALRRFGERYHPESQLALEANDAILSTLGRVFEDEEGMQNLATLMEALKRGEIAVGNIPGCLKSINFLRSVNLATAKQFDEAVEMCEGLLMRDPSWSRGVVNTDPNWCLTDANDPEKLSAIDDLREKVFAEYREGTRLRILDGALEATEYSGCQIARNADAWFGSNPLSLISIRSEEMAMHLRAGNVISIDAIFRAIHRMHERGLRNGSDDWVMVEAWDKGLLDCLSTVNLSSPMRSYQLGRVIEFLDSQVGHKGDCLDCPLD